MADSTGPILLAGGLSFFNHWIGNNQGIDVKIIVGTGIAAGTLALLEHANRTLAVGIAWIALITSLLLQPTGGNSTVNNLLSMTGVNKS
jgi:hypothetical protein